MSKQAPRYDIGDRFQTEMWCQIGPEISVNTAFSHNPADFPRDSSPTLGAWSWLISPEFDVNIKDNGFIWIKPLILPILYYFISILYWPNCILRVSWFLRATAMHGESEPDPCDVSTGARDNSKYLDKRFHPKNISWFHTSSVSCWSIVYGLDCIPPGVPATRTCSC